MMGMQKIEMNWGDVVHALLGLLTGIFLKTWLGTLILIVYFVYQIRDMKEDFTVSVKDLVVYIMSVLIGFSIT